MSEKKKILVTGGAGLIGLETCRQLSAQGHEVHLFDLGEQILRVAKAIPPGVKIFYGSIVDLSSLRAAMVGCDGVVHLAALLGVKRSEEDRIRCIEINISGTKNVLDSMVQNRVKKVIFGSSSEVYGEPLENPITERAITQGKTVYAITKLAGEEICKAFAQAYSVDYTILRFFNCYGSYQTAQFVVPKFIRNVLKGEPPVVYGDGKQVRSYTYVEDTVRAIILALFNEKANGEILNIGTDKHKINLMDLANLVIRVGGREHEIKPTLMGDFEKSDRTEKREIFQRFCSPSKAQEVLGWRAEVPIEEGLRRVFQTGILFDRWENLYDIG